MPRRIPVTYFGVPLMEVKDYSQDVMGCLALLLGVSESPRVDWGANLALSAKVVWMPSVWVKDPQIRWAWRDEDTAELIMPS